MSQLRRSRVQALCPLLSIPSINLQIITVSSRPHRVRGNLRRATDVRVHDAEGAISTSRRAAHPFPNPAGRARYVDGAHALEQCALLVVFHWTIGLGTAPSNTTHMFWLKPAQARSEATNALAATHPGRQRALQASVWPYAWKRPPQRTTAVTETPSPPPGRSQWWRSHESSSVASGLSVGYVSPSSTTLSAGCSNGRVVTPSTLLVRERPGIPRVRCLPRAALAIGTGASENAVETEEAERLRWRELFGELVKLNESLSKQPVLGGSTVAIGGRRPPSPAVLPASFSSSEDDFRLRLNEINKIMLQRWRRKRGLGGGGGLWGLLGFGPWADDSQQSVVSEYDATSGAPSFSAGCLPGPPMDRDIGISGRGSPLRWLERLWDFIWEQVGLPTFESPPTFVLDAVKRSAVAAWERELAEWNPFWLNETKMTRNWTSGATPGVGSRSSSFLGGTSGPMTPCHRSCDPLRSQAGSVPASVERGTGGCRATADSDTSAEPSSTGSGDAGRARSTGSATASSFPVVAPEPRHLVPAEHGAERSPLALLPRDLDERTSSRPPVDEERWTPDDGIGNAKGVHEPVSDPVRVSFTDVEEVSVLSYIRSDEEFPIYELIAVDTPFGPAIAFFEDAQDAHESVMCMDEAKYPHLTFETIDFQRALECCYYEGSHFLWIPKRGRLPQDVKTVGTFNREGDPDVLRAPIDWHVCAAEKLYPDDDLSADEALRRQRITAENEMLARGFIIEPIPAPERHVFPSSPKRTAHADGYLFSIRPRAQAGSACDSRCDAKSPARDSPAVGQAQ